MSAVRDVSDRTRGHLGDPEVTEGVSLDPDATVNAADPGRAGTDDAHPVGEVLAVDIGPQGLRARRTGAETQGRLDITDLVVRPTARGLVQAVRELTYGRPPAVTAWSLGGVAADIDPIALLTASPPTSRTVVVDAATATLVGALGGVGPGVVLEMTTGARTMVTDFDSVWRQIDGWGPILGDRGSAAWLGAQGLAAAVRFADGVPGGSEELLRAGRRAFGDERTWRGLLERLPAADVLADFAPLVGDVARRDPVAEGLCRLAGEHLADALCSGSDLLPGAPITATGPLLLVDAVKVSFAAALGKRYRVLLPALGDSLSGVQLIGEHVLAGRRLPHRPPHVFVQGQNTLAH